MAIQVDEVRVPVAVPASVIPLKEARMADPKGTLPELVCSHRVVPVVACEAAIQEEHHVVMLVFFSGLFTYPDVLGGYPLAG